MPEPLFTIPAAGITNGVLADVLRLEVETDPAGLANLIVNPDGRLGGYGWVSPVAGTVVRSSSTGTQALEFVTASSSVATNYTSELVAVTAGQYVAARWTEKAFTDLAGTAQATGYYRARFEFVDAAGAALASSAQTGYFQITTAGTVRQYGAVLVPATATRARLRIDAYSNTSGGNPTANRVYSLTGVTVATAATSGALQTNRSNLVTNPSFETNTTGWAAVSGTLARVTAPAGFAGTACARVTAPGTYQTGVELPAGTYYAVTGDTTYTLSAYALAATVGRKITLNLEWYNGTTYISLASTGGAVTSTTTGWTRATLTAQAPATATHARVHIKVGRAGDIPDAGEQHYIDAVMLEPATEAGAYFDGSTNDTAEWTYNWTGTAHASTSTAFSSSLDYIEPVPTVNVLDNLNSFGIQRAGLAPGTLKAELLDSTLDPAEGATLLRPGRAVVLSALTDTGEWRELYTGTMPRAATTYELVEDVPDEKRARIELEAYDNVSALAAASRPEAVATINELPYVLEDAGVPWNVNGSGNQVATATVRARDENTTALDQVALTRDTAHGYAWVDKKGIVQAWDALELDDTPVLVLDEDVYSDVVIDYDTDACINEVQVTVRSLNSKGETVETVTTVIDSASIAQWGRHRAEFVVLAPVNATTFANEVLAANATPQLRLSACTVNIRSAEFLPVAHLELYDAVTVRNVEKGIDQLARVTGIAHEADPEGWMVALEFSNPSSVAAPQVVPPLTPTGNNAAEAYSEAAGTVNVTLSAATTGTAVVTFPAGRFTAAPVVTVSPAGSSVFAAYLSTTPTATGFTVGLRDVNATAQSGTWAVHWRATQMTETSGPG